VEFPRRNHAKNEVWSKVGQDYYGMCLIGVQIRFSSTKIAYVEPSRGLCQGDPFFLPETP
jgi:hypothetical protein